MKRTNNWSIFDYSSNFIKRCIFWKLSLFLILLFMNDQLVMESEVWHRGLFVSKCFFHLVIMSVSLFSSSSSVLINIH